ncbi:radical SAM protein [Chloroflexi bacterium CFX2]|nr:radical SAM protein [Chloroflexi bacterium CFX2]
MKIEEIQAKSILVASKLPDADYVINPYTGCQFGCLYCYATFMGRFVNEPRSNWGNYVYVKINAVDVIKRELASWSIEKRKSTVLLSSVTDPYHGVEKKYRLTRGILQALVDVQYPGCVSILTKSPMVLRDVDILKQLPIVDVGLTVTTTDDKLSRFLEVTAPLASRRLDTLGKLNAENIPTYAFVGPLLPHFRYQPKLLEKLFRAIKDSGTRDVYVEHINLPTYVKERIWKTLRNESKEIQDVYEGAETAKHREILGKMVEELIQKYGLRIRLGGTIYHKELPAAGRKTSDVDIREVINKALADNRDVNILYEDSTGNTTERSITPIEWTDFDERKIRAYCHLRKDERQFNINRIRFAELMSKQPSEP